MAEKDETAATAGTTTPAAPTSAPLESDSQTDANDQKNKPIWSVDLPGGTKAALWANRIGDGRVMLSLRLARSYQDGNGEWRETNSWPLTHADQLKMLIDTAVNEGKRYKQATGAGATNQSGDDTPF